MKPLSLPELVKIRQTHPTLGYGDDHGGFFVLRQMRIIASNEVGWDHVSVSLMHRCPTWEEMCEVKNLFFYPNEMTVQYHPPQEKYINNHNFVLHMWRPHNIDIPLPPSFMV